MVPKIIGRYSLAEELGSGGMATVHLGRLLGPVGFSRVVAIKRLHVQFARDPEFVSMFLDEARLAARVRHPNVVQTLDVVASNGEVFLVLDFVHGEALSRLLQSAVKQNTEIPLQVATAIVAGALHGLHAAHDAVGEDGKPLSIVHRDVSPQNILVGLDGVARVLDFGIAKASMRVQTTTVGQVKGKLAYMAPEQFDGKGGPVTRRADIFAAGVVLWETLTRRRLFKLETSDGSLGRDADKPIPRPSDIVAGVAYDVEEIVMRALSRDPAERYATAREMAIELEKRVGVASSSDVGAWVEATAGPELNHRARRVADIESQEFTAPPQSVRPPQPALTGQSEHDTDVQHTIGTPTQRDARSHELDADTATAKMDAAPTFGSGPTPPPMLAESRQQAATVIVPRPPPWRAVLLSAAIVLTVLLVLVALYVRPRPVAPLSAASAASPSLLPPAMSSDDHLPPPPPTAAQEPEAPATSAEPSVSVAPVAPVTPRPTSTRVTTPTPTPSRTTTTRDPCDPPYVIDDKGKHFKPECL